MRQSIALPLPSEILVSLPPSKYDRRLTDKILAAFAHAYEAGELGIAGMLRRALEEAERRSEDLAQNRRHSTVLRQADLWVAFVDARKAYRNATERTPRDEEEIEDARLTMIETYRAWSDA